MHSKGKDSCRRRSTADKVIIAHFCTLTFILGDRMFLATLNRVFEYGLSDPITKNELEMYVTRMVFDVYANLP